MDHARDDWRDGETVQSLFLGIQNGWFFAGEGLEFAADKVGGEAGGEERAVDGGEFFVSDLFHLRACKYKPRTLAPEGAEFALDALTDDGGFVVGLGGFGEGVVDVAVGNAAGAEVARDAEPALFADFGVGAGELFGVAGIVELAGFLEAGEDDLCEKLAIGAAEKFRFHFVDGVCAAHEDTEGVVVEVLLGVEFAGAGEHKEKMR
jgi:hypothetical protein